MAASILATVAVSGCIPVEMPLHADATFPSGWPEIRPLDAKCESLSGEYRNDGTLVRPDGTGTPMRLTELLGDVRGGATATVLVETRPYLRAWMTNLTIASDARPAPRSPTMCACNEHTLVCVAHTSTWAMMLLGFGGSQLNAYLANAGDGSLIAKLQRYSAGVAGIVPYFYRSPEPWARFERMEPAAAPAPNPEPEPAPR